MPEIHLVIRQFYTNSVFSSLFLLMVHLGQGSREKVGELKEHNSLDPSELFINRELSSIRFNARVVEEAPDPTHPPLERVKLLAACGT